MAVAAAIVAVVLAALLLIGIVLFWFTTVVSRKVDALLPPLGGFIEIDGHRLHYIDEGVGPPIVMIHGLAGQARHFTYGLTERLKDEFRLIVVDRPGSGHSARRRGASAALFSQAKTMAQLIQALELERPLIVGHSLGGGLALALALEHPEVVGGLALISPVTHPPEDIPAPFRGMAIGSPLARKVAARTLALPGAMRSRNLVLDTLFGPEPAAADFGTKGGSLLVARPVSFIGASEDLHAIEQDLPGMVDRYGELKVPVGVLFGDGDRVLDYRDNGEALAAKAPGGEIEILEGRGHMIPITAPDECAAFIRRMAARVFDTPARRDRKSDKAFQKPDRQG